MAPPAPHRSYLVRFLTPAAEAEFRARLARAGLSQPRKGPGRGFDAAKEKRWLAEWRGMPDYANADTSVHSSLRLDAPTPQAARRIEALLDQRVQTTRAPRQVFGYFWPPRPGRHDIRDYHYVAAKPLPPRYPVYVISKGRHESRRTSRLLETLRVPYRIVVEPQERAAYAAVIDPRKILVLPFANLGRGSIPARNWVLDHARREGHKRHWILDDNIWAMYRRACSRKVPLETGNVFRAAEDFVDRYANVPMAGFNYQQFAPNDAQLPPYLLNTRIYSCILLDNAVPFRWRGKYNEDTDLSLRLLKAGYCTVLFNAFLIHKVRTMKLKGGNTEEVYRNGDKREEFARSLQRQHPDVVRVVWRYDRWHHAVDYRPFKANALVKKAGGARAAVDNYGMRLAAKRPGVVGPFHDTCRAT